MHLQVNDLRRTTLKKNGKPRSKKSSSSMRMDGFPGNSRLLCIHSSEHKSVDLVQEELDSAKGARRNEQAYSDPTCAARWMLWF